MTQITMDMHVDALKRGYANWQKKYAGPPGSGPEGETCRTCEFKRYSHHSRAKHPKCGLNVFATAGDATTIRTSAPACHLWRRCAP